MTKIIIVLQKTCSGSDLTAIANKIVFSAEDYYWLNKERISLEQAAGFLMIASTWPRRFNNLISIEADIKKAISLELLEITEKHLVIDFKWLYPTEQIKEIYSPMGFVMVNTELLSGIAPEYLFSDLHESGVKIFQGSRLKMFLEKEWLLLKPFMTTKKEDLMTLLVEPMAIELKKGEKGNCYLTVNDKKLTVDELPVVYDRFGFIHTKIGLLHGDQLFSAGIRFNRTHFTGYSLNPDDLGALDKTKPELISVTSPDSWFYYAGFNSHNASDINLAGYRDFIYLARQTIPSDEKPDVVKVIRKIKEITNQNSNSSFQDYANWRDNYLKTGNSGTKAFYALVLMQELINELIDIKREEKYQLFWPLWKCVAEYGSREDKGRFIEAALDWSLIEGYYGIYGYISTLKNGYMHNALLWEAFMPDNRDVLEPELCAELAVESLNQGVFANNPERKAVISRVFGAIDDFFREKTGTTFLASFHPPHFSCREYVPYKDQIYAGYWGKIMVAELEPLVFHQPLINFSKSIFLATKAILSPQTNREEFKLPEVFLEIIKDVVD